jgi:transposase
VVVTDPHAAYVAGVRAALPDAVRAVDYFHLIMPWRTRRTPQRTSA